MIRIDKKIVRVEVLYENENEIVETFFLEPHEDPDPDPVYHPKGFDNDESVCPECGSHNLRKLDGCLTCMDCGWGKCSL